MPPIIFYIGIGGIVFLLIAYAVMELARPWPTHSKERAKKKHDEKVAKRHAERDEILEEAVEADKMYQKLTSDETFEQAFESEDPTSPEEEIDETSYWLSLIIDSGLLNKSRIEPLFEESQELCKIVTKSIATFKTHRDDF